MAFKLFRSPERDRQTDIDRVAPILAAIETAIADAQRERDGLRRRYDAEVERASMATDSDAGAEEPSRIPEHDLKALEASITGAAARIRTLEADIEKLTSARRMLSPVPTR